MWKLNKITYRCSVNFGSFPLLRKVILGQPGAFQFTSQALSCWGYELKLDSLCLAFQNTEMSWLVQNRHWPFWNFYQNRQSFNRMGRDRQEGDGVVPASFHTYHQKCLGFWDWETWTHGLQQQGVDLGNANPPELGRGGQRSRSVFPVSPLGNNLLRIHLSLSGL